MPFILIIIFLLIFGCVPKTLQSEFEDIPVVEGYLKQGEPISIRISQQISLNGDASTKDLDNLDIKLYEDDAQILLQSQGNGVYKSNENVLVKQNKSYRMRFTYNGKITTAETTVPSEPVDFTQSLTSIKGFNPSNMGSSGGGFSIPTNLELKWKNPDNSYYIVVIENVESNPELINTNTDNNQARTFRITPTQGISTEIRPMQFTYYGNHKLRLYHINADYATLYNTGSNSSQNLYTPTTSVVNGVGIFTGMSGKVLNLNVYK